MIFVVKGTREMDALLTLDKNHPAILHFGRILQGVSDREFFEFCQLNKDWRIERTAEGDLIIMPPTGGETGRLNFALTGLFSAWVERDGAGFGFDSSTGFTLPNGAKRSPDLSWIRRGRWEKLNESQRGEFPPLCPDFVVELRSKADSVVALQTKMEEYIANGASLGWLIDPIEKKVYVYRPSAQMQRLDNPLTISGESVLRGFTLDMKKLWG